MCASARSTVPAVEDDLPDLELPVLPRVTEAEVRFLTRVDPALAHERIALHNMRWARVMMRDLKRLSGRDDLERVYWKTVVFAHQQAD